MAEDEVRLDHHLRHAHTHAARLPALLLRLAGSRDPATERAEGSVEPADEHRRAGSEPRSGGRGRADAARDLPRLVDRRQPIEGDAQRCRGRLIPPLAADVEAVEAVGLGQVARRLAREPRDQEAGCGEEPARRVEDRRLVRPEPCELGRDVRGVERVGDEVDEPRSVRSGPECRRLGLGTPVEPGHRRHQRAERVVHGHQRPADTVDGDRGNVLGADATRREHLGHRHAQSVPPPLRVDLGADGVRSVQLVCGRRLGDRGAAGIPERGLRARGSLVNSDDVHGRSRPEPARPETALLWWCDGSVEVPEILPALAGLPEEDLALDQPAGAVDARDGRHVSVAEGLACCCTQVRVVVGGGR